MTEKKILGEGVSDAQDRMVIEAFKSGREPDTKKVRGVRLPTDVQQNLIHAAIASKAKPPR